MKNTAEQLAEYCRGNYVELVSVAGFISDRYFKTVDGWTTYIFEDSSKIKIKNGSFTTH